jgi:hypothetical protein
MFNYRFAGACFVLTLAHSLSAEAKLYKWVDNKGVTHYGEVIPPEYADKQKDTLKKSGMLEKRPETVDVKSVQAKEEAEKKRILDNQAAMEQQRRDNALLNTYSNENEIDQAKDRSLVLINARIESNRMLLKSSQTTLEGHKQELENRKKSGKVIPASLTNDISRSETRILGFQAELNKSETELTAVKERFEKEKLLYRKLKSGSGNK